MKTFLLIVTYISFNFAIAADCKYSEKLYNRAIELRERSQFLLSSMHLSEAIALNCNLQDKYRYEYSKNMIALEEKLEALAELNKISKKSLFYEKSQLQKKLFLNTSLSLSSKNETRFSIWKNRRSKKSFNDITLKDLSVPQQNAVITYQKDTRNLRLKDPAMAAGLSIIPGLGQTYLGAYQSAAISFTLNSLFLLAAKDFERQRQYGAASASYMVFSITYVGNILNSYRSANNINNGLYEESDNKLWNGLFSDL